MSTVSLSMQEYPESPVKQMKVSIRNEHGVKLVGVLHDANSRKLVILCHGFRSSKDYELFSTLAAALAREGIPVFRFDFAGNGESEGIFQYGNYRREADDLHAVILYFHDQKYEINAIVGHSKGGNVVLLYASIYQGIQTVINMSGRFALDRGIEERLGKDYLQRIKKDGFINVLNKSGGVDYKVTKESLLDRLNTNMREACLSVGKDCRVLTVHGSADEVVPVNDAYEIAELVSNHRLHIIEGADHCYTSHRGELIATVVNFIKAGLCQREM